MGPSLGFVAVSCLSLGIYYPVTPQQKRLSARIRKKSGSGHFAATLSKSKKNVNYQSSSGGDLGIPFCAKRGSLARYDWQPCKKNYWSSGLDVEKTWRNSPIYNTVSEKSVSLRGLLKKAHGRQEPHDN